MPEVSIIVPNYNHANFLKQRLDSIFNQTSQDFEVILLDDCSNDNSIEILNEFAKHIKVSHFVVNKMNSGSPFKQWKKGIELSKGEFVWIAESDDWCDINFLENVIITFKNNTKSGLVYCQSAKVNDSNAVTGSWVDWTNDLDSELFNCNFTCDGVKFIDNFLIHKNVIPNASAVVFRKEIYYKVEGVNYDIKYCGDWLLWLKLLTVSNVSFISDSLNYFRYHQNSVIYKAVNFPEENGTYPERYQITMRKIYTGWLKGRNLKMCSILSKNKNYISKEYLLQADWYSNNGKKIKSICAGFRYFLLTKDIHYLKRLIKLLIYLPIKKEK